MKMANILSKIFSKMMDLESWKEIKICYRLERFFLIPLWETIQIDKWYFGNSVEYMDYYYISLKEQNFTTWFLRISRFSKRN